MIPMKNARETIYKMLKFGFIYMQDVPKTADHASSRTFFLYGSDTNMCIRNVISNLYTTLSKINQRIEKEMAKYTLLLEKLARTDVQEDESLLDENDVAERKEMQDTYSALVSAYIDIDRALLCLVEF
jgi:DNA-directed RNA polymerase III subunit RPC3